MKLTILLFSLFFFNICNAQKTSYYKLTKYKHNGVLTTNVSGGQFITFLNDICYESDKKGMGLGHGTLQLKKNYSDNNYYLYMGNSYWGSSTTFKFKHDMSMLNVVTDDGDIYVYKRMDPPPGAKTSSLIRKESKSGEVYRVNNNSILSPQWNSGRETSQKEGKYDDKSSITDKKETRKACSSCKYTNGKCSVCKGTKKIHRSYYGVETLVNCDNCYGTGRCPTCGGDGWIEK